MKLTRERTTSGATTFGINAKNSNKGIVSDYTDCRHAKRHYADCRQCHIDCSVQTEREREGKHAYDTYHNSTQHITPSIMPLNIMMLSMVPLSIQKTLSRMPLSIM
jgi:anaerobic selenocysteine-containing dehydrogenase